MTPQEKESYLNNCESAFNLFCSQYPDYPQNSEAHARWMAEELAKAKLRPDNADHLAKIWKAGRPQTAATEQADADEKLTNVARALIEMRGWTSESIAAMNSQEFEAELRRNGMAFSRAVEILCPKPDPQRLQTLGEVQAAAFERETAHRAELKREADELYEAQLAESRRLQRPRVVVPGIVDTSRQAPIRTLTERDARIAEEQRIKDNAFMENLTSERAPKIKPTDSRYGGLNIA